MAKPSRSSTNKHQNRRDFSIIFYMLVWVVTKLLVLLKFKILSHYLGFRAAKLFPPEDRITSEATA